MQFLSIINLSRKCSNKLTGISTVACCSTTRNSASDLAKSCISRSATKQQLQSARVKRHLPVKVGREEGEKRGGARREDMAMHTGVIPL